MIDEIPDKLKAELLIDVNPSGREIDVNASHSEKAHSPILVIELLKVTCDSAVHWNANFFGNVVTPFPTVIDFNAVQPSKVRSPIDVTLSGITILVRFKFFKKASLPIVVSDAGSVIVVNPQLRKPYEPIVVTVEGIFTDVSDVQLANASSPIVNNPSGISIEVIVVLRNA